ncbi:MAG: AsnC family transcriptional regulator [Desulfobacula sp.]|uniref:Lrp/AsnC family transcriptional regulator n=1 Tax=Desulfobacula sp. TaxID=2593537 RepID=UPI001EC259BA|nr:AsnC family transcriptional regulator [Desulfobacula sp.]MBT3803276.1 AsnC family transcriptional regulator [Desulfobacula sp.]MBT4201349.1 AsnC family transcriptional regulator [Desulfobacula sp.]MBT5969922.1 AsnC family transcriptional regulator [Desulfobacula sp.]
MNLQVDDIDSQIIKILNSNGRTPNTEIANKLKLSETAIRKRIKKLLDDEVIQIVAVVNQEKMGYVFRGNICIKTDIKKIDNVKNELNKIDRIWYIALLTGAFDFDIEFSAKSQEELRMLIDRINKMEGVIKTDVSIRLQLLRNRNDWEK